MCRLEPKAAENKVEDIGKVVKIKYNNEKIKEELDWPAFHFLFGHEIV